MLYAMLVKKILALTIFFSAVVIITPIPSIAVAGTDSSTLQENKQEAIETAKDKRAEIKEKAIEKRTALKDKIQKQREAAKEKFSAKREAFKAKLETIKDEKKKAVVERIDTKMAEVNKNRTDRMSEILEKLTSILDKVKEKASALKEQGKDTSAADLAITQAQSALTTAQTALATQAGKEYVASISTESTLKNTVGKTVSQMQTDLRAVHKTVVDAKQAVQNAAKELRKVLGEKITVTPTTAAQ